MLRNIIKLIFGLKYDIRGYHDILLSTNSRPIIIELIGFGGKTTIFQQLKYSMGFKKIKPVFKIADLKYIDSKRIDYINFLRIAINNNSVDTNFLFLLYQIHYKTIIMTKYSEYAQIWDEGLFKGSYRLFINLNHSTKLELAELLKNYIFVIVLPSKDIIIERYVNRLKKSRLKKVTAQDKKKISYGFENEIIHLNKFVNFIKEYGVNYIEVNNSNSDDVTILTSYLKGIVNEPQKP